MFFRNRKEKNFKTETLSHHNKISVAIEQLEAGDVTNLSMAYRCLETKDTVMIQRFSKILNHIFSRYTIKQIIHLEIVARKHYWLVNINFEYIKQMIDQKSFRNILIIGSFLSDGYYREECILQLRLYENTLPYIILRLNDWVEEIRYIAESIVEEQLRSASIDDIFNSIGVIDKVINSRRRSKIISNYIYHEIVVKIEKEKNVIDWNSIHVKELCIRRTIYKIIVNHNILDFNQQIKLLIEEKDNSCKLILFKTNLQKYTIDQLDYFLTNRNNYIRVYVLEQKYERLQENFKDIHKYLLDKSRRIREFVIYVLKKQGYSQDNIIEYYINKLQKSDNDIAIISLGQQGNKDHVKIVLPYLNSKDLKIVKATINALGLLKYQDKYMYWNYLCNTNVALSKEAFKAIVSNKIRYGANKVYMLFTDMADEHIKNYALKLLVLEDSWDRLPYLLKLYHYEDVAKRPLIQMKVDNRDCYGKVSKKEAQNIRNVISQMELPKKLVDNILFDLKFVEQD